MKFFIELVILVVVINTVFGCSPCEKSKGAYECAGAMYKSAKLEFDKGAK